MVVFGLVIFVFESLSHRKVRLLSNSYIFNIAFHAHIQNEKIYMLQYRTEVGIADWLVEEGIDKQDIVLAYFSPSHRRFLDFAEA